MDFENFRGAPGAVKNFMTSSDCFMEGAPPKRKRYQPWGYHISEINLGGGESALFSRVWGSPAVRNLEIQNLL